jgi:hypothetical protein
MYLQIAPVTTLRRGTHKNMNVCVNVHYIRESESPCARMQFTLYKRENVHAAERMQIYV